MRKYHKETVTLHEIHWYQRTIDCCDHALQVNLT